LAVPAEAYQAFVRTIERDCRVSCLPCHLLNSRILSWMCRLSHQPVCWFASTQLYRPLLSVNMSVCGFVILSFCLSVRFFYGSSCRS